MPDRLAYDEAMLFAAARLRVPDPELKRGKIEVVSTKTTLGAVERPWGIEGGFAVVYKFRTYSGKFRALRCFRIAMNQDMQFRYGRIGPFFKIHASDITADFRYYDAGIAVEEHGKSVAQVYPVIDMEWIDGLTLLETVATLSRQRNTAGLKHLVQQWSGLLQHLRRCGMAHGDLAAVNVMVRPEGGLVLVDYDGVYIPEFADLSKVLLGQPDYQHPDVIERNFDAYMDDFSALVIYTALLALADQPQRWERYAKLDEHGRLLDSNLLFTLQDFQAPQESALFRDLEQTTVSSMTSGRLVEAARALRHACTQPANAVRFPAQWLSEQERPASTIACPPTMVDNVDNGVSERQPLPPQPSREAALLDTFLQACAADDDEAIAAAYEEINNFNHYGSSVFSVTQLQRAQLAQRRRSALARFRVALSNRRPLQIATAYDDHLLQHARSVTEREQQILMLARQFQQAYKQNDELTLLHSYEKMQQHTYHRAFIFSDQERQLVQHAYWQQATVVTIRTALARDDDAHIRRVYQATRGGLADTSDQHLPALLPRERQRIDKALRSEGIEVALTQKEFGSALELALQVQQETGYQMNALLASQLQKAALRFVCQQDLTDLTVQIVERADGNYADVRWRWPAHPLIKHAVLTWSTHRWPLHLRNHSEHATDEHQIWVEREDQHDRQDGQDQQATQDQQVAGVAGACLFPIGSATHLYLQGYTALRDYWDASERWFFSDGLSNCLWPQPFLRYNP